MSNFPFVPRATALAAATFALSLSTTSPAVAGTAPVSTGSNSSCGTGATAAGTYASYQGTGQAGCTVGPLTFFDFSSFFSYTNGIEDVPASTNSPAVGIAPGANLTGPALKFSSSSLFVTDANTTKDYYFEYYIDPPIDILGFSLDDLPFMNAYVEASVCVGATFNQSLQGAGAVPNYSGGEGAPNLSGGEGAPQNSCSYNNPIQIQSVRSSAAQSFVQAAAATPQYYYLINNGTADVTQNFATMDQFADVILHVHIGPDGSITDFGTGAVLGIPEPGEWALTGLGGLVMAGALRRKRRRATSA